MVNHALHAETTTLDPSGAAQIVSQGDVKQGNAGAARATINDSSCGGLGRRNPRTLGAWRVTSHWANSRRGDAPSLNRRTALIARMPKSLVETRLFKVHTATRR